MRVLAAVTAMALGGCASDAQIVPGGMFGTSAAVTGALGGGAGRATLAGGTGAPPADVVFQPDYGAYDYRTNSFGGDGFNTRCARWDSGNTGRCVLWRQS